MPGFAPESLLQALFAAPPSTEGYYQGILKAAREVGLTAPEVLRALLWHAPWDAAQHPETWDALEKLLAEAQEQPETGLSPVEVPFELILEQGHFSGKTTILRPFGAVGFLPEAFGEPAAIRGGYPAAFFQTPAEEKFRGRLARADRADFRGHENESSTRQEP